MDVPFFCCVLLTLQTIASASVEFCTREEYNPCKTDWYFLSTPAVNERRCLFIDLSPSKYVHYYDRCNGFRSTGLEVYSREMQHSVIELLVSKGLEKSEGVLWLDIHYFKRFKSFRWSSRRNQPLTYKPASFVYKEGNNCYVLMTFDGRWTTSPCSHLHPFVCMTDRFEEKSVHPDIKAPATPKYGYFIPGSEIELTCEGFIGPLDRVSFALRQIRPKKDYTVITEGDPRVQTKITYRKVGSRCLKHVNATLKLTTPTPYTDTDSVRFNVYCFFHHNVSEPAKSCFDPKKKDCPCTSRYPCATTRRFDVKYLGRIPEIKIDFHDSPNILHINRTTTVSCEGCVGLEGLEGNLTFYTRSQDGILRLASTNGRNTTYKTSSIYAADGCSQFMTVSIQLQVVWGLNFAQLYCMIVDLSGNMRKNGAKIMSPVMKVEKGPQTPILQVDYHTQKGYLTLGRNLTASCAACVGKRGTLTWSLINKTSGKEIKIEDLPKLDVQEYSEEDSDSGDCTRHAISNITIRVTRWLKNTKLVCHSYQMKYLDDFKVTVESLPFHIIEVDKPEEEENPFLQVEKILPWVLLAQAVVILVICLGRRHMSRNRRPTRPTFVVKVERRPTTDTVSGADGSVCSGPSGPSRSASLRRVASTDVDTGRQQRLPKTAKELSELLGVPLPEAQRRLKAFRESELTKLKELRKKRSWGRRKASSHKGLFSKSDDKKKKRPSSPRSRRQPNGRRKRDWGTGRASVDSEYESDDDSSFYEGDSHYGDDDDDEDDG